MGLIKLDIFYKKRSIFDKIQLFDKIFWQKQLVLGILEIISTQYLPPFS